MNNSAAYYNQQSNMYRVINQATAGQEAKLTEIKDLLTEIRNLLKDLKESGDV